MNMSHILETKRLYLRNWQYKDSFHFYKMNSDPEVMRYLPKLLTRQESDELKETIIQGISHHGIGFWAVELKQTKRFIGFTGISPVAEEDLPCGSTTEIGWRLAKHAWGHGYATEVAKAVLKYAFYVLHLQEVVAFTATSNQRSRSVMERIGMTHNLADDFEHPALEKGNPLRNHVLYRIKNIQT